ncbi:Kynurenine 3-monooxygenase [Phycisphaerales bacterium]|nr:Kynurenine 3-monooxygenase [Phycisphaerales bacterium]
MKSTRNILIVGAGLAGCLLAVYLARRGHSVRVYERRPDPRAKGYQGGRSINLALSARGLWGLAGVGLDRVVMDRDAIAMPGRMLHDREGRTAFQPYSKNPTDAINSVSRGGLNLTLLNEAAKLPNVEFVFDHWCEDVDLDAPAGLFKTPSGAMVRVEADVVVGADGAFSPVRGRLQKTDRFDFSQSYLRHGYKELHIPPGADGKWAMDPHALHIWPRGGSMMIALPNRDGSFTCTLFWPFEGDEVSFGALPPGGDVEAFFRKHYPDAVPLMPTLREDYARNPVGSLMTVRCWPWQHGGKVAILGDAAHAVVPFYGQGMNCAFEDVRVLAELLDAHGGSFAAALPLMQDARKANADAIADMALENFVEMRDLAGRPEFQYRKKIERVLHEAFGEAMTPQYNLVSFSTVPYVKAREQGRRMDGVLRAVAERVPAGLAGGEAEWARRVVEAAKAVVGREGHWQAQSGLPVPPSVIDITPAVTAKLGVWPGDTPLSREVLCDITKGDTVTLSTLRATVHLGAHADGPNHYGLGAPGIGERSLSHYIGPCRVLEARVGRGGRVRVEDVVGGLDQVTEARVLIKTGTFPNPDAWNSDFAAITVDLVEALAARGVITIGIDTPSVDLQDCKDLRAHKAILKHDIAILEGLDLSAVRPGVYELIAAPLKLMGFDASPVRAVLRAL